MTEPSTTNIEGTPSPTNVVPPAPDQATQAGQGQPTGQDDPDVNVTAPVDQSTTGVPMKAKRSNPIVVGLRKFLILLWKCFIQRRRSWVMWLIEFLSFAFFGVIAFVFGSMAPTANKGGGGGGPPVKYDFSDLPRLIQLDEFVYAPKGVTQVEAIIKKIEESLGSSKTKNFKGFKNEKEVENYFAANIANNKKRKKRFAAIIFESYKGSQVKYKIRLPLVAPDPTRGEQPIQMTTSELFFSGDSRPRDPLYHSNSFLYLQLIIDESAAVVLKQRPLEGKLTLLGFPISNEIKLGGLPVGATLIFTAISTVLYLGNSFVAKNVVGEKETGIRELMKLSGYPGWMQWLAWYTIVVLQQSIYLVLGIILWSLVRGPLTGRQMIYESDASLWFFVMLIFLIANTSFVFFVCSFFKSSSIANGMVIFVTLVSMQSLTIKGLVAKGDDAHSVQTVLGISVLPVGCFDESLRFLALFEGLGMGARWKYLGENLPNEPAMNLGYLILMQIFNIVWYFAAAVYIESVLPSEYGVPKPWYFPINPLISLVKKVSAKRKPAVAGTGSEIDVSQIDEMKSTTQGFEAHQTSNPAGVIVKNIVKKFGPKIAVDHVNLSMYSGEIFALLGHNGAGKTTLISVLTGLYKATSGTAMINGYDIKEDMDEVRRSLGLCPQHNMLFKNLTVMEHLRIFGQMKGQSSAKVKAEAKRLLQMMQITDKANTMSMKLSGGQKRKLCLGMALIGEAKAIILDEPTSGMDPEARREIWDILLEIRGDRTILLTTHYMEEADVLGDRIAIMADGRIQCCGSPTYLKKYYGTGYTLKVSLLPGADRNAILPIVQKHISNASLKPIILAHEVFITLPTETATSSALTGMFGALTEKKEELKIESLGLSVSSMDEVFLKVGELSSGIPVDDTTISQPMPEAAVQKSGATMKTTTDTDTAKQTPSEVVPTLSQEATPVKVKSSRVQMMRLLLQALAILIKKCSYTRRKIGTLIFMLVFPALMMILVVSVACYVMLAIRAMQPALEISFASYSSPVTYYIGSNHLKKAIGSSAKQVPKNMNVEEALTNASALDPTEYKKTHIIAASVDSENYTMWFNQYAIHSAPLAVSIASTARSRGSLTFIVTNHPLQSQEVLMIEAAEERISKVENVFMIGFVLGLALMFGVMTPLAGCFIVQPVEERLNTSKQLQLMTGINPLIYWTVNILWDLMVMLVITILMIIFIAICETYGRFSSYHGLGVFFLLTMSFGNFLISFAYFISHAPGSIAGGVSLIVLILLIPTIIAQPIGLMIRTVLPGVYSWFVRLLPLYAFGEGMTLYGLFAGMNSMCNLAWSLPKSTLNNMICTPNNVDFTRLKLCCSNCKDLLSPCFQPKNYIAWGFPMPGFGNEIVVTPGIGQIIFCLFLFSVVCLGLHFLIEFGVFRMIRKLMIKSKLADFEDQVQDDDILAENNRVADMISRGAVDEDAMISDTLCKSYGSFSAVSRVSFGVHFGECFGLLGTNGAGKTTTFKMITGSEIPSCGDAYEGKIKLSLNRAEFLGNIGYCPQFDAFIPCLTGEENLLIFALLRGIPWRQARMEVRKWLAKVGLEKDGHIKCKNYSGGMKRRLSAAIAMIGDPAIVLLDEPTSGVDPVSRRQFWKVLESARGTGRQAIILTSHSMDECEVLCSRLGIMVNGQLQCLGGVQHLKHKFAQGYTLNLRLKQMLTPEEVTRGGQMLAYLNQEITKKFEPCILKEQHETLLKYQINNTSLGWNVIYGTLEEIKKTYGEIIEDYSVGETTLEEVFLAFAQKQYGLRKSKTPLIKRILTCQC